MTHSEQQDKNASSTTPKQGNNQNTEWVQFLARRAQTRERLNKQQQKESSNTSNSSIIPFEQKCSLQTTVTPSSLSPSSPHNDHFNDKQTVTIYWIDLYEDVMSHISSFCTLSDLQNIMLCCKGWSHQISYSDEHKWRIWYNAMHYEIKSIESLDRTGTSNHFIVIQNCYDSFDSVYHFAKFSRFSPHLLPVSSSSSKHITTTNPVDQLLSDELLKINAHSQSVVTLYIDSLHKKILFEYKEKLDDEEASKTSTDSIANPELLYINSYDTASDTDTADNSNSSPP